MATRLTEPARRVVKLLFFAFVVHVFVLPQLGGARRAVSVLGSVRPQLVLGALVLEALAFLAYARMMQLLLSREHRPGLGICFGSVLASTGVNHVVPGGAATTAAVSYRLLGRAGVPRDELGFALATQAIGSAVVLNVMLWLALLVSIPSSGFQPVYATAAAFGALLMVLISLAVVAMLRGRDRFADRVARSVGRLPRVDAGRIRAATVELSAQVEILARDPDRLRMVAGLAAANWLFDAAALWVMLTAFGHRPGVVGLLIAYGLANVLAAIPISPGGLGVIEAVLIPTLVGFGAPAAEASVGVVAYRLINFWLPIPAGAASYFFVSRATSGARAPGFVAEINQHLQPDAGSGDQAAG